MSETEISKKEWHLIHDQDLPLNQGPGHVLLPNQSPDQGVDLQSVHEVVQDLGPKALYAVEDHIQGQDHFPEVGQDPLIQGVVEIADHLCQAENVMLEAGKLLQLENVLVCLVLVYTQQKEK